MHYNDPLGFLVTKEFPRPGKLRADRFVFLPRGLQAMKKDIPQIKWGIGFGVFFGFPIDSK